MKEESDSLTERLIRASKEAEALQAERKTWKDSLSTAQLQVRTLESQVESLIESEKTLKKTIQHQTVMLQHKENDTRSLTESIQAELQEREATISKLKRRNNELEKESLLVKELRTRVEVMLDVQAEHEQDKIRLKRLREKMNEYKDLQQQFKALEAKRDEALQENSQLTGELQQQRQLVKTLQSYKSQFAEAQAKIVQLKVNLSVKENEIQELQTHLSARDSENVRYREHNSSLTRQLSSSTAELSLHGHADEADSFALELHQQILTPELKEKMRRVEIENESLKKKVSEYQASLQQSEASQQQLAESENTISTLQQRVTLLNEQLQSQIAKNTMTLVNSPALARPVPVQDHHHHVDEEEYKLKYEQLKQQYEQKLAEFEESLNMQSQQLEQKKLIEQRLLEQTMPTKAETSAIEEKRCKDLELKVDLLNSSLSALGLRYGGRLTVNTSNAAQRLSLLAKARQSSITL